MSQKYIKTKNNNSHSQAYGKYYAQAVYDNRFIETDEIADFIQTQATLKKSDIKASIDELAGAIKHFLELGQKVRIAGLGIFKVGFSAIGVTKLEDCTAATITTRRVLFQPEIERIVVGQDTNEEGKVVQKYVNVKRLVKDVLFEETHDNAMNVKAGEAGSGSQDTGGNTGTQSGGTQSGGTEGGGSDDNGGLPPDGGGGFGG